MIKMEVEVKNQAPIKQTSLDRLSQLLYCGGVRGAISMLIFWTSIFMMREVYSHIVGRDQIFHGTAGIIFWIVGLTTILLGLIGLYAGEGRLKYLSLLNGSFVQIWISVQFYVAGNEPNSFVPAATALWFFGAAVYFNGVMNDRPCVTKKCK